MNPYVLMLENLYGILKEKEVQKILISTALTMFYVTSIFFTWFDYQITWNLSNGHDEGNEMTRYLWLTYGKWTLIPQILGEIIIATLSFFYYKKSKFLFFFLLIFCAWSIYVHYNGGMSWLT